MDGNQSVVQALDSVDLPSLSLPSEDKRSSVVAPSCHPWTLDFGIHAEKTVLQHLCITARAGAWEPAKKRFVAVILLYRSHALRSSLYTSQSE